MNAIMTRNTAAKALDLTIDHAARGPRTHIARNEVAEWLDRGGKVTNRLRMQVAWLLSLAASE